MALNIKNPDMERLAEEISQLTGESKTEAIRRALEERRSRLTLRIFPRSPEDLREVLQKHVWSHVPKSLRGKRLSRKQREKILG